MEGPSSSSSSSSTPHLKCQVCSQTAHGNHFGVDTCRACAAFFRRVFVTHKQDFKCREGDDKCTPDVYGRWNCKKCRTDRCFALGMKPDNIQLNRDVFVTSDNFEKKKRKIRIMKNYQTAVTTSPINDGRPYITFFDLTPLVEALESTLSTNPESVPEFQEMTSLKKLAYGLREMRKSQLSENMREIGVIGKRESFEHWRIEMQRASSWLMYFDEFQKLSLKHKTTITKCMWLLFARMERSAMTAELRRNNKCRMDEYVFKSDTLINTNTLQWNYSWLTSYSPEQMKTFLGGTSHIFCEQITDSMMAIQPTDVELCYLLCDLCFYYIGNKLGGEIQEIVEHLQSVLANDLHQYYMEEDRNSRYSHRLNKLLKINQQYKTLMEERRKMRFLGYVFSAFRVEWSHPDVFVLGNLE